MKLDELLEKQNNGIVYIDLEYIVLSVGRLIWLVNGMFLKKKK